MANTIYTPANQKVWKQELSVETDVLRMELVRDTSTYVVSKDHEFRDSFTGGGGVPISVASYAPQTLTNVLANLDLPNDRVEIDFDDVAYGPLEAGQTVSALFIYQQVGGDDLSPGTDPLLWWIDTATGLPLFLNGGAVNVTIDAQGFVQIVQP